MRADCDEQDDADLIEEVMRRIGENGRLVARRIVGGHHPSIFTLAHIGPAPPLGAHEWIDIRNSIVLSGSMCRKCRKLRAEDFDQK